MDIALLLLRLLLATTFLVVLAGLLLYLRQG